MTKLTKRESECLQWAAAGKTAIETAVILGISVETVREYRKRTLLKLNCYTMTQAVAVVLERPS